MSPYGGYNRLRLMDGCGAAAAAAVGYAGRPMPADFPSDVLNESVTAAADRPPAAKGQSSTTRRPATDTAGKNDPGCCPAVTDRDRPGQLGHAPGYKSASARSGAGGSPNYGAGVLSTMMKRF